MTGSSRRAFLVAFLLVSATGFDPWQSIYRSNRDGNRSLLDGDPESAIGHYSESQALAPDDPRILYNLGNALASAQRMEEADRAWRRATELGEGDLARDAWFNRGVASLQRSSAQTAVEAFSQALMLDPTDTEARRNLELALRMLSAPPQEPPPKQEKDEQDQDGERDPSAQPSGGDEPRQEQPESEPADQGEPRDEPARENRETAAGENAPEAPSSPSAQESPAGEGESTDAEKELAERLLDRLDRDERDALRRALRRRAGEEQPRENDW